MLDDRTAARRELDDIRHPIWPNRLNRFAWRSYLGREPGSEDIPPYAAPARRNDLSGLPTTFISVGDIDLLYEENRHYADRLRQHGVSVTFETIRGAPHGFEEIARRAKMTKAYLALTRDWLRDAVGASTDR
jgi:acetyl esterase/lipase